MPITGTDQQRKKSSSGLPTESSCTKRIPERHQWKNHRSKIRWAKFQRLFGKAVRFHFLTCPQLFLNKIVPKNTIKPLKNIFIHFSSSTFPQLFLTRFRVVFGKSYIFQVLNCAPMKNIDRSSSATISNSEQRPQIDQATCMATNRAKIFSSSSTLGFNTVWKRFSSSKSKSVAKRVLSFPESTRKLSPKLPKFPFTIFIASDNLPTLPSLSAQVQPPNGHDLAETCRRGMPLTPKTSFKRCRQSVSVAILDVTFKPHRAHDQACIATRDCLAQRGPLRERGQDRRLELDRCRKLHVERGLLLRRSLWRLRLVSLGGQGTMGNTFGNQDA